MAKNTDKLRLLLVTKPEDPDYMQKPNRRPRQGRCFLFTLVQVCCILIFFVFLAFIALGVIQIEKEIKQKNKNPEEELIPGSDFCKSVNAENMSLVALGFVKGIKEERSTVEAKNKVYYITDHMFTDQEACGIEAALRLLQDKSVFVIELGNFTNTDSTKIDYIRFLREQYTNLNTIRSSPDTFFKGSPFQNYLKTVDKFSMFAAKVLLVWQFGGTVLSPNFLLLNRRLFDSNEGFCEVDQELLFCPNQCGAYVYQLVKILLDMLLMTDKPQFTDELLQQIVDKSVVDYCGDQKAVAVGCVGINRIKSYSICEQLHEHCQYLRLQQWKIKDQNWKNTVKKFCPKIVGKYMPNSSENNQVGL